MRWFSKLQKPKATRLTRLINLLSPSMGQTASLAPWEATVLSNQRFRVRPSTLSSPELTGALMRSVVASSGSRSLTTRSFRDF